MRRMRDPTAHRYVALDQSLVRPSWQWLDEKRLVGDVGENTCRNIDLEDDDVFVLLLLPLSFSSSPLALSTFLLLLYFLFFPRLRF